MSIKEIIYNENRVKVLNYSLKEFDFFFEFFDKKSNPSLLLTKQEFYTYTIQIAIFQIDWRHCIQKEIAATNKRNGLQKPMKII
jgi:hypothetical protein